MSWDWNAFRLRVLAESMRSSFYGGPPINLAPNCRCVIKPVKRRDLDR